MGALAASHGTIPLRTLLTAPKERPQLFQASTMSHCRSRGQYLLSDVSAGQRPCDRHRRETL